MYKFKQYSKYTPCTQSLHKIFHFKFSSAHIPVDFFFDETFSRKNSHIREIYLNKNQSIEMLSYRDAQSNHCVEGTPYTKRLFQPF